MVVMLYVKIQAKCSLSLSKSNELVVITTSHPTMLATPVKQKQKRQQLNIAVFMFDLIFT